MIDISYIGSLSGDGLFVYDLQQKKFTYLNDRFAEIVRKPKDDLLADPGILIDLVDTEEKDYLSHEYKTLIENKVLHGTELVFQYSDKTRIHVCCKAYLMENGNEIVALVEDITKLKEHEDFMVNYGARKDTLLDMMSHNLTGPLQLSKNILHWLHVNNHNRPEVAQSITLLQDNTQECIDIVEDFLREEHIESEKTFVKNTRFDVIERIMTTLDKLIATNKNKTFSLIADIKHLYINTDNVKFFQIIHNLLSNAIKFTPDGGKIDMIVEETENSFIFRVRDNGIGIPAELQPELFKKRTSAGRDGLDNQRSKGMGLSIAKALTEIVGGKLTYETKVDFGSTFSIELPKE